MTAAARSISSTKQGTDVSVLVSITIQVARDRFPGDQPFQRARRFLEQWVTLFRRVNALRRTLAPEIHIVSPSITRASPLISVVHAGGAKVPSEQ